MIPPRGEVDGGPATGGAGIVSRTDHEAESGPGGQVPEDDPSGGPRPGTIKGKSHEV
jgi:hypothetical protein